MPVVETTGGEGLAGRGRSDALVVERGCAQKGFNQGRGQGNRDRTTAQFGESLPLVGINAFKFLVDQLLKCGGFPSAIWRARQSVSSMACFSPSAKHTRTATAVLIFRAFLSAVTVVQRFNAG
ncbi:MAG: hypothetical protein DME98_16745 [Verrucomicrobia bacterium]|nr:MAG: hypothetical protein DME98_16745 [Verrucomicrobiota bacterium]